MHPNRRKGIKAELEVATMLSDELGVKVTRRYNLGTHDDIGDILLDNTTIQVANYADLSRAVREKLPELERQQANAGADFGALFCRRRGGEYVVVMTPAQFFGLWREAQPMPTDFVLPLPPPSKTYRGKVTEVRERAPFVIDEDPA
jgi:hypothetical protein